MKQFYLFQTHFCYSCCPLSSAQLDYMSRQGNMSFTNRRSHFSVIVLVHGPLIWRRKRVAGFHVCKRTSVRSPCQFLLAVHWDFSSVAAPPTDRLKCKRSKKLLFTHCSGPAARLSRVPGQSEYAQISIRHFTTSLIPNECSASKRSTLGIAIAFVVPRIDECFQRAEGVWEREHSLTSTERHKDLPNTQIDNGWSLTVLK